MASRSIVIIGGGIIGTTTAYYLSRHPHLGETSIRIIESSYIAAGASGKAGGFIAKDWHRPPTDSLGDLSWDLHQELATEHNGAEKWGYRRLTTFSLDHDARAAATKRKVVSEESGWIAPVSGKIKTIGTEETTAQVHPFQFTEFLVEDAKTRGLEVIIGEAHEIQSDEEGSPVSLVVLKEDGTQESVPADDIVFAAGPWTGTLAKKLLGPKAGAAAHIGPSRKSTSLVIKPPEGQSFTPHAIFGTYILDDGSHAQPEIFPRPDNTLYICGGGLQDHTPLPDKAKDVSYNKEEVEGLKVRLKAVVKNDWVEKRLEEEDFVKQACYRPDSTKTSKPVIGKFGEGMWIASGHDFWGIALAPGTGKVMAELLIDGEAKSADISALQPEYSYMAF